MKRLSARLMVRGEVLRESVDGGKKRGEGKRETVLDVVGKMLDGH